MYEEQEVAQGGGAMAEGSAGRPGALLGNQFNFFINDFIIFIKYYDGRAQRSATTSTST